MFGSAGPAGTTPKTVAFIMLNPSTGDAVEDDPTIRRCKGFAQSWGYTKLVVVNLFAYRSTNPDELRQIDDPVGRDNMIHVLGEAAAADMVVCAWGALGPLRDQAVIVLQRLTARRIVLHCLGRTKGGHPRHPLYVPKGQALEPFP